MNITSINQSMNLYSSNVQKLKQTNKSTNIYNTKPSVNFRGNANTLNLLNWVSENNITQKTLESFDKMKRIQHNNESIMKKIRNAIPVITSTQHTVQHAGGETVQFVTQKLSLMKKDKLVGIYGVEYNLNGQITDDFLKTF